jgi:hypothetical protein
VSDVQVSHKHFAERLGRLIDLSDSVRLSNAHSHIATMGFKPTADSSQAVTAQFLRVRTAIVQSLVRSFVPGASDTRVKLPPNRGDASPDEASAFEPYKNFYTAQQRDIDGKIQRLQSDVREAAAGISPKLAQLAALDMVLGDTLALHARKFFSAIPKLLAKRYSHLHRDFQPAVSGAKHSNNMSLQERERSCGKLHRQFCAEMQGLLLAEIEARLLPVLGIIEALNTEADKNTYE